MKSKKTKKNRIRSFLKTIFVLSVGFSVWQCGVNDDIVDRDAFNAEISRNLQVLIKSGDQQRGVMNHKLLNQLIVEVIDIHDRAPKSNQGVRFKVTQGEATILSEEKQVTDLEGMARAEIEFGKNLDPVTVEATLDVPVLDPKVHRVEFHLLPLALVGPRLVILDGDSQIGKVGEKLPTPIAVITEDEIGKPMYGQTVEFKVVKGATDTILNSPISTDSYANASTYVSLGSKVGEIEIEASWKSPVGLKTVVFHLTALPEIPAFINFVSSHFKGGKVPCVGEKENYGSNVVVRVTDRFGNPVPERNVGIYPTRQLSLDNLGLYKSKIYRTDENGEISFVVRTGQVPANGLCKDEPHGGYCTSESISAITLFEDGPVVDNHAEFQFTKSRWLMNNLSTNSFYGATRFSSTGEIIFQFDTSFTLYGKCYSIVPNTPINIKQSALVAQCPSAKLKWPTSQNFGKKNTNAAGIMATPVAVAIYSLLTFDKIAQKLDFFAANSNVVSLYAGHASCLGATNAEPASLAQDPQSDDSSEGLE